MADVEKININSTNYDIADAKALRNKSTTAEGSFVDTKAGTSSYPTIQSYPESNIIGYGAYAQTSENLTAVTAYGYGAKIIGPYSVAVGRGATAAQNSVAYGYNANARMRFASAFGSNAAASSEYSLAVGYNAKANANYSTIIGENARTYQDTYSTYATAVGANAIAASQSAALGNLAKAIENYSVALGASASANAFYSVQLGPGTNAKYGSLQFRNWQLVDNDGKIPEERLPNGIKTVTPRFPNLYDIAEEKVSETAILYTGATNDGYKNSQFYRGRVRYGYPHFGCGWVDSDWLDSYTDVTIDQQKLFIKLAEVTKQRIDDDDVENGLIGGDNSEQVIYLIYDADNDYYLLRFDSDSFEKAFNGTPDDITGLSFDDLADYGIYFRNFHKPSDLEGEYEICDIYYYAPVYIDSYDWNNSPSYINYFQFLDAMNDSNYGVAYVIPNMNEWDFEIDRSTYWVPIIPKTYEWDDDEYDGVEFRWEWDSHGGGSWIQYINGEDIDHSWTTEQMYTTFGIKIEEGEEGNVEYISLLVRGGDQRYWEQFDPVDSDNFCTKQEKQNMQSDIRSLQDRSFRLIQNARNLNDIIDSGTYHIQALGCTNLPSTASASMDMFLFVTRSTATNVKQVLITDYVRKAYDNMNYGTYCSNMYVRTLSGGTWRSWQVILTPDDLMFLPGFDKTKKQVIGHNADGTTIQWIDAQ